MLSSYRVLPIGLCLVVVGVLAGCTPEPLRLTMKPGDKHVIEVTNNLTTTVNAMGTTERDVNRNLMRVVLSVESVDAAGVATVKTKIENADLNLGMLSDMLATLPDEEGPDLDLGRSRSRCRLVRTGRFRA